MLPEAFSLQPDFARRYADRLPAQVRQVEADASHVDAIRRTRESFGYQWTVFSEMAIDFRQNFLELHPPLDERFFPGKRGLDLGCGFGRHIYNAAKFGAEMVGVDISDAIESTRVNTEGPAERASGAGRRLPPAVSARRASTSRTASACCTICPNPRRRFSASCAS